MSLSGSERLLREYISESLLCSYNQYLTEDEMVNEILGNMVKGMVGAAKSAVKTVGSALGVASASSADDELEKQEQPGANVAGAEVENSGEAKNMAASLNAVDQNMQGLALSADQLQSGFQETIAQFPEEARTGILSGGEEALENLRGYINDELEGIQSTIEEEAPDQDASTIRQQSMIALGSVVAKIVKDLATQR